MTVGPKSQGRLSRDLVVQAAIELADRDGIEALTMRALADELGTKPMSLYHYVDGKDSVLQEMVEAVFAEMEVPPPGLPWRDAIRHRCVSARAALVRHAWAVPLLESGTTPGPVSLRHHEAVLATFERGGLSLPLMAHAYAILDSFVYGFALQEANLPVQGGEGSTEMAGQISQAFDPSIYPTLVRLTVEHVMRPDYSFGASFEYGLDLLLEGLEAAAS
jgi:AcrR family transcriptional regulator